MILAENADAGEWIRIVSADIERRIVSFLSEKIERAREQTPASVVLVDMVRDLTTRSAKRIRPILVVAGFEAVRSNADLAPVISASVAAELLQSYMLIHDDWMDQDDMRRGKPTAHVLMTERYRDPHIGASVAILTGNLACAYAWEVLVSSPIGPEMICAAVRAFWEMQEEVVTGQLLDIVGGGDVSDMHRLKTGSYTVSGPLRIGAILSGASEEQHRALREFGLQLGETFQLRDDVLGLYGDPKSTGKPVGNDLRMGKRTALVQEAMRTLDGEQRRRFDQVFNHRSATEDDIESIRRLLEETGVRGRIEQQINEHVESALGALESAPFERRGIEVLKALAMLAAYRQR